MAYDPDAPPQKPTSAPSWVLLGFVLGALFILAMPSRQKPAAEPAPVQAPKPEPLPPPNPGRFEAVETVFEAWSQYAVWQNERTEICVYDPDLNRFAECYEVLRSGDQMYYRSIPALTRPVLTHGVPPNSPVEFTEPSEVRTQWLKEVRDENWRDFSKGVKEGMDDASGQATKPTPNAPAAVPMVKPPPPAPPKTDSTAR